MQEARIKHANVIWQRELSKAAAWNMHILCYFACSRATSYYWPLAS